MARQEIDELRVAQNRKRLLIAAAVALAAGLLLLGGWLMSDSGDDSYSLGSPCQSDCGVYSYDGWICLEQDKYCSRPCGENHPKCPLGFSCLPVEGAPRTVVKSQAVQVSTYCLKGAP